MTEQMADHWWWRPGWARGRRFYTWHITFAGAECADLHRLAADYRKALAPVAALDLIPDRWMHLTTQGLGFVDEVDADDIDAIVDAAQSRIAAIPAFDLVFGRPIVTPEAVQWAVDPTGPNQVRAAIRAAIGEVWPEVPEQEDGFRAHVSIAYSSGNGPAEPVEAALDTIEPEPEPATVRITEASLIELNRDNRMYEWTTYASAFFGN